jgi:hypothetical protein
MMIPASGTKVRWRPIRPSLTGEHGLVGFDVDVHVLELADLLPVAVDQLLAVPFADVLVAGYCLASSSRYRRG